MAWEVDWSHPANTGQYVMARNPFSHQRRTREWHRTATGGLRALGIKTPVYRKDSWEIDWKKRNGKLVWGRNPASKMPKARKWHWIDHSTLDQAGLTWRPANEVKGRWLSQTGYVQLSRRAMTDREIAFAELHELFRDQKKSRVDEHRLVACMKYGGLPPGTVVRHRNGIKTDNRPDNLILGTTQENTADHDGARLAAMLWREYAFAMSRLLQQVLAAKGWKP